MPARRSKIESGDYDHVMKVIWLQHHLIEQRICAASEDLHADEMTAMNLEPKMGMYGCVHHQTNHVFKLGYVKDQIIYPSYTQAVAVLKASFKNNHITAHQRKTLHRMANSMRTYYVSFLETAKTDHITVRIPIVNAYDRAKADEERKLRQSSLRPSTVNSSRRVKNYADLRERAASIPLNVNANDATLEAVAEYYRCFRKKLFFSYSEANAYISLHQSGQVGKLLPYFCEFCTGHHIGHPPKQGQKEKTFFNNAKDHWRCYPEKSNAFVEHREATGRPVKASSEE